MTRTRLVAALAALAVGFGITLVGTTVADSDDAATDAVEERTDSAAGDDGDNADQEVVEAAEPDDATTQTEPLEPTGTDDPVESTPEPVVDTVAEAEPVPEPEVDEPGTDDGAGDDAPDADREPTDSAPDAERVDAPEDCFDVIVIADDLDGDLVLRKGLDYQLVEGEVFLLADFGLDASRLDDVAETSIRVDDAGIFFCADGAEVDDIVYDWFYAAPCDDDVRGYFEDFFGTLDVSDDGVAFSDEEVFLYVVAERIERFNPNTDRFDEFFADVGTSFAGFTDDCSPTVLDAELASQEFFCAAGNLSATDDLLQYLGQLGLVLPGCGYDA